MDMEIMEYSLILSIFMEFAQKKGSRSCTLATPLPLPQLVASHQLGDRWRRPPCSGFLHVYRHWVVHRRGAGVQSRAPALSVRAPGRVRPCADACASLHRPVHTAVSLSKRWSLTREDAGRMQLARSQVLFAAAKTTAGGRRRLRQ